MSNIPQVRSLISQSLVQLAKLTQTAEIISVRVLLAKASKLTRRDRSPETKRPQKSKHMTDALAAAIYRDWLAHPNDMQIEIGIRHGVNQARVHEVAHYPRWEHVRNRIHEDAAR